MDEPMLLCPDAVITFGDVTRRVNAGHAILDKLRGQTVAVAAEPSLSCAISLLCLDGVVGRIVLLPKGMEASDSLIAGVGIDHVFELADDAWPGSDAMPWPPQEAAISSVIETRWLLLTSGTTGSPKIVEHRLQSLVPSVSLHARNRSLRWGLLYELSRFAGLQVFLQAVVGGGAVVFAEGELGERLRAFAGAEVNALSATPSMWRRIVMAPESELLSLTQATLGGEIADQAILDALRVRFPTTRLLHIYASTEAGVGFAVSDGREGFPVDYLTSAPKGVELRISDDGTLLLRRSGCEAARYVNSQSSIVRSDGFVDSQDLVEVRGDRVFFKGRVTGSINVGGNKVMPEEVEKVIRESGLVREAVVAGKRNALMGNLLHAHVVLASSDSDAKVTLAELKRHCRARLPAYKVPATWTVAKTLPLSVAGKLSRPTEAEGADR